MNTHSPNQKKNNSKSFIQIIINDGKWVITGITLLGGILGVVTDAQDALNPYTQSIGIVTILILWGSLELLSGKRKIVGKINNRLYVNTPKIKRRTRFIFIGLILCFLIPTFMNENSTPSGDFTVTKAIIDSLETENKNIQEKLDEIESAYNKLVKSIDDSKWAKEVKKDIKTLINEGKLHLAIDQLTRLKQYEEKQAEEHSKNKAEISYQIGLIKEMLLNYEEAIDEYQEAIEMDSLNISYHGAMGELLYRLGNYSEAKTRFETAYELSLDQYGARDSSLAECLNNLGAIHFAEGNFAEAIPYFLEATTLHKTFHGTENKYLAEVTNNLAYCYLLIGEHSEALKYANQSLKIYSILEGEDSKDVADSYDMLGCIELKRFNYIECSELFAKALNIRENLFGSIHIHPDLALSHNNLGAIKYKLLYLEEAINHYKQALNIREKLYGTCHPSVAETKCNLGLVYLKKKNYEYAKSLIEESLIVRIEVYNDGHPQTGISYFSLGNVAYSAKKYEEALTLCNNSLRIFEKQLGNNHDYIYKNYILLGKIYAGLDESKKGYKYLNNSLEFYTSKYGEISSPVSECYFSFGEFFQLTNEINKSIEMFEKSLNIDQQIFKEKHPKINNTIAKIKELNTAVITLN